jgi:chromosome segregation ATPase
MTEWALSAADWTCLQERMARSDARFDAFLSRFDDHVRRTNENFQRLDTRLDRVEGRLERLETRAGDIEQAVGIVSHDTKDIDRRLRVVECDVQDLIRYRHRLWGMITAIAALGGTLVFAGAQAMYQDMRLP